MLLGALVMLLAADFVYAALALTDGYWTGHPVEAGWLMSAALFATAGKFCRRVTRAGPPGESDGYAFRGDAPLVSSRCATSPFQPSRVCARAAAAGLSGPFVRPSHQPSRTLSSATASPGAN